MDNGGQIANRGFIFQAIVALIECLEPNNEWDQIKNEPNTDEDKVDIMLYKAGRKLSAIQVKSSINDFQRADAKKWLETLRSDAKDAENICLYLVGDSFTHSCKQFIEENSKEVKTVPFSNLQSAVTLKLIGYIKRVGLGDKVRINDLDRIDANLFAEILKNSIAKDPIVRDAFEATFQRAIPKGEEISEWLVEAVSKVVQRDLTIPQCLTPIPLIDKEIGLVGREGIVEDIRKMFEENTGIVLVSGLGGIGKTATMQGICNDLKDDGHYVAWINCGDSLRDDLLMLRDALGVPKEEKLDEAYGMVKVGIQRLGKKLYLFMDNLSREVTKKERDAINELGVHVMITSRKENLPFRKRKLGSLADKDAIKMFYGYYGGEIEYDETVWKIIDSVNSHTLLIELLAKAAREEGGTLDAFYGKLEKEGFFDVSEEEINTERYDENLTIEECVIRLYKISNLSDEQLRIMKLFTIFTPEKEIYYKIREWAGLDRKEMKKLVDLGWLERGGHENGYRIHQIVRDSLERQLKKDREEIKLEDYGNLLLKASDKDSYLSVMETYEIVRERIILMLGIANYLWMTFQAGGGRHGMLAVATGVLINNLALVYREQGNYEMALEYYEKALTVRESVLGKEHPETAQTYNNIAVVYSEQGNYKKALEYNLEALAIFERVLGLDDLETATTYNNIASLYQYHGDNDKAMEYCTKALAIREHLLGIEHPLTAQSYNNIASLYQYHGDFEEAIKYYAKALDIRERVLGRHPETAETYNNIASLYQYYGDSKKALEFFMDALDIREHVLGMNHPDTVLTYNNIAFMYHDMGDYDKALEYYEKALTVRESVLGKEHPATATTYNNLGGLYEDQGDYEKALENYMKALNIVEKTLGENHPNTARTYSNLASVYSTQGHYKKALEYYWKALAIKERVLGTTHPDTALTYNGLAVLYDAHGRYAKALDYYRRALRIYLITFGEEHPITKTIRDNLKRLQKRMNW